MKKFAKLFDSPTLGQILLEVDTYEHQPEVAITYMKDGILEARIEPFAKVEDATLFFDTATLEQLEHLIEEEDQIED